MRRKNNGTGLCHKRNAIKFFHTWRVEFLPLRIIIAWARDHRNNRAYDGCCNGWGLSLSYSRSLLGSPSLKDKWRNDVIFVACQMGERIYLILHQLEMNFKVSRLFTWISIAFVEAERGSKFCLWTFRKLGQIEFSSSHLLDASPSSMTILRTEDGGFNVFSNFRKSHHPLHPTFSPVPSPTPTEFSRKTY